MSSDLASRITSKLQCLIGLPLSDCWRVADMAVFEFGSRLKVDRDGQGFTGGDVSVHLQCHWRVIDSARILFGSGDLFRPADRTISREDFDWDQSDSVLDVKRRSWIEEQAEKVKVVACAGDAYGGFRIQMEAGLALEAFPCDSRRGEYSEQWRLLGRPENGHHFVVCGYGIEGIDDKFKES